MRVDDWFGLLLAAEVYALASKRFPPITRLCRRHRLLVVPVVTVIAAHLLQSKEEDLCAG